MAERKTSLNDMIISQIDECRESMNQGRYQEAFNSIIMLDALMTDYVSVLEGKDKEEYDTIKYNIEENRRISNERIFKEKLHYHRSLYILLLKLAISKKILKETRAAF